MLIDIFHEKLMSLPDYDNILYFVELNYLFLKLLKHKHAEVVVGDVLLVAFFLLQFENWYSGMEKMESPVDLTSIKLHQYEHMGSHHGTRYIHNCNQSNYTPHQRKKNIETLHF